MKKYTEMFRCLTETVLKLDFALKRHLQPNFINIIIMYLKSFSKDVDD